MMRDLFDELDEHDENFPEVLQWSFNDYEEEAMQFAVYEGEVMYPLIGLVSEVGEVADKIKKTMRDHDETDLLTTPLDFVYFQPHYDRRVAMAKELGDVLWYVTALAVDLGFSLDEIASMNMEKLRDRSNRGKIQGSGDNR